MSTTTIRRLDATFTDWDGLLAMIQESFAYMDSRIDPPSSAAALTAEGLQRKAEAEIAFVAFSDETLAGCVFCRPEEKCLYIGKLAVAPGEQEKASAAGCWPRPKTWRDKAIFRR